MTGRDHTDALIATLRQPALPAERAGEAAAIASMVGTHAGAAAPRGSRPRRGVAIVAITAASLGVGGLAAAGPGVFPRVLDFGTPESDVPEPEPVELPDAVLDAPGDPAAPDVVPGADGAARPAVPTESPAIPAAPDRTGAGSNENDRGSSGCVEDGHGQTVTDAATTGGGDAVDDVARPACGAAGAPVDTPTAARTDDGLEPPDTAEPNEPDRPTTPRVEPTPPVQPDVPDVPTPSADPPVAPEPAVDPTGTPTPSADSGAAVRPAPPVETPAAVPVGSADMLPEPGAGDSPVNRSTELPTGTQLGSPDDTQSGDGPGRP